MLWWGWCTSCCLLVWRHDGVDWSQLLLLPCCPASEMQGCCSNPQFTLILLHVDFRAFTYNCNVRAYLVPATCIILLFWASPVKTTSWTMIYTEPQWAEALLPLCSGKVGVSSAISVFTLASCDAVGHGAAQQRLISQENKKFLDKFSEEWLRLDWAGVQMACPTSFASQGFPCFVVWDSWASS